MCPSPGPPELSIVCQFLSPAGEEIGPVQLTPLSVETKYSAVVTELRL